MANSAIQLLLKKGPSMLGIVIGLIVTGLESFLVSE